MDSKTRRKIVDRHFKRGGTSAGLASRLNISRGSASAERTQWRSRVNHPDVHHPKEKKEQIKKLLCGRSDLEIYEVYSGRGGCTRAFRKFGDVTTNEEDDGDAIVRTHFMLASNDKFDVIDIDGYGWPGRLLHMGIVDALKSVGVLFLTVPQPQNSRGNGHTLGLNRVTFGTTSPEIEHVMNVVRDTSLMYKRNSKLIEVRPMGRIWRFAFRITRMKANDLWGTGTKKGLHSPFDL